MLTLEHLLWRCKQAAQARSVALQITQVLVKVTESLLVHYTSVGPSIAAGRSMPIDKRFPHCAHVCLSRCGRDDVFVQKPPDRLLEAATIDPGDRKV